MSSLQKLMTDFTQILRLHEKNFFIDDFEKLGAIDTDYLEAVYQLKDPTIGTISKLLNQSTPNTNYHLKKLIRLGLIEKQLDEKDRRVTHLHVTDRYIELVESNGEFWNELQNRLEENVSPIDLAIFKRVLKQVTEIISEQNKD